MAYSRTTWQNSPSVASPLSADNLNNIETGILGVESSINALAGTVGVAIGTAGTAVNTTGTQGSVTATQGSVAILNTTLGSVSGSVSSHVSSTTSVHGITDTANLVYTNNATLGSVATINASLGSVAGTVSNLQGTVTTNTAAIGSVAGTVSTNTTDISNLNLDTRFNPPGVLLPYAGSVAPNGYLLCDGGTASRITYANLFSAIGTAYGAGNGSTTFNIPDLRGRVPVCKGTHADVDALGDSDGISTVANRRPKHQHTVYDPGHSHSEQGIYNTGFNSAGGATYGVYASQSANVGSSTTGIKVNPSGAASDTTSPQDSPAYLVVNYIIKT